MPSVICKCNNVGNIYKTTNTMLLFDVKRSFKIKLVPVPIKCPLVISCPTSIESNIVTLIIFVIFYIKLYLSMKKCWN